MSCRLFNHWLECKWRTLFIWTKFFRELSYNAKCNLQPSEEPEWVHLKHCLIEHNVYPTGRSRALQNASLETHWRHTSPDKWKTVLWLLQCWIIFVDPTHKWGIQRDSIPESSFTEKLFQPASIDRPIERSMDRSLTNWTLKFIDTSLQIKTFQKIHAVNFTEHAISESQQL